MKLLPAGLTDWALFTPGKLDSPDGLYTTY